MIQDRSIMRGWPASLVDIAEVIGVAAALRLVDAFGGMTLYVPEKLDPAHRLVQSIGMSAAEALIARYGLEKIEVPTLHMARTRKALIANTTGPTHLVARELGVTTRWVRMVRNVPGADPRQMDMFAEPPKE
ncbi:MAG: hypothetical protein K5Q68_22095 [Roseococcus sp.]|nr:hypothetical protein [Roseococcus sp.]